MDAAGPDPSSPIAVFDSGVGGLTVLHEFLVSLPEEDYVYLGDDARFPYGAKSEGELRECVERNTAYLIDRGAKLVVIACNSAAGAGLEAARALGRRGRGGCGRVIEPEAEIAAAITDCGPGRRAGDRGDRLRGRLPAGAGPPAPRAHRDPGRGAGPGGDHPAGLPVSEEVVETVRSYCAPLRRARVDTVILGCTHYPLVRPMLQRFLGRDVRLVSAGHAVAATAQRMLEARQLETARREEGEYSFVCTGDAEAFREIGTRFLQLPLGVVERVEV